MNLWSLLGETVWGRLGVPFGGGILLGVGLQASEVHSIPSSPVSPHHSLPHVSI